MAAIIDYRGKSPRKTSFGIPLVTAKIVKGGRILTPDEYIAEEDYDDWMSRGIPEAGDIVLTTEAPLGEIGQLDGRKVALAQRLITLRGRPDVLDNRFLKFAMQSAFVQNQLRARATGTTVHGVRQSELRRVQLPIPPISEQQAIAHILGALDDKIELILRMNETLEAMARAIFKSWFVDFDPVRAKAEGRQPFGMDTATAALFPAAFQDSLLGKIPKGWAVGKSVDVVAINERSISPDYSHRTIEYVEISSVSAGKLLETARLELPEAPDRAKRLVSHGDTIWSCVRPNRKSFLYIHNPAPNLVVSTGFVVLTPKKITASYLYEWVTTNEFVEYLSYSADGSAYPAVRPERFSEAQLLLPVPPVLDAFERIVGPLRDKIASNDQESRHLATIRDALLPKLISGEIRVKNAEKLAEKSL